MSALTAPVEDGVRSYLAAPVNFDTDRRDLIEADAFRAGTEWAVAHLDWRVLGGLIPGPVEARHVRLGDRVRLTGDLVPVVGVRHHGSPGCVYLTTLSAGGAEITAEYRTSERVHVYAVKAVES